MPLKPPAVGTGGATASVGLSASEPPARRRRRRPAAPCGPDPGGKPGRSTSGRPTTGTRSGPRDRGAIDRSRLTSSRLRRYAWMPQRSDCPLRCRTRILEPWQVTKSTANGPRARSRSSSSTRASLVRGVAGDHRRRGGVGGGRRRMGIPPGDRLRARRRRLAVTQALSTATSQLFACGERGPTTDVTV